MKKLLLILAAGLAPFVFLAAASGQKPTKDASPQDSRFFPLEDLRPGMKGIARTVFAGSEPEEFGVEILGVLFQGTYRRYHAHQTDD